MNVTLRYGAGTYQHPVYGAATTAGGETVIVLDRPWLPVDVGPLLVIGTPAYGWWRDMAWADMGGAEPASERAEYELRAAGVLRAARGGR